MLEENFVFFYLKTGNGIKFSVMTGSLSYLLEYHRGAALPTNTPGIPCIFDPQGRAGICGDWLLGSSLESAALSGMALANHVSASLVLYLFLFYFTNFLWDLFYIGYWFVVAYITTNLKKLIMVSTHILLIQ